MNVMIQTALPLWFALSVLPVGPQNPPAQEELARLLPAESLIYVEAPGLAGFLKQGLSNPLVEALLASELGSALIEEMGVKPAEAVAFIESLIDAPLFETAGGLLDGGFVAGLHARGSSGPELTLAARSSDVELWSDSLETVMGFYPGDGGKQRFSTRPVKAIGGSNTWRVGDEFAFAQLGGTLVASTDAGLYNSILARLAGMGKGGFGATERFKAAQGSRADEALLWGWLDLDGLIQLEGERGKLHKFRALDHDPSAQSWLGTCFALLGRAADLSAQLKVSGLSIELDIRGEKIDPGPNRVLLPEGGSGQVSMPLRTPNEVARLVFYRDFGSLFQHRAELFPADRLPAFSRVSNELAPIMGGLDLGEDILPKLSPWIRVVARSVTFDGDVIPELVLPAVALMIDLNDPELGDLLKSSFQTAISVTNIERVQQGYKPMLMFLEQRLGIDICGARFLKPDEGDGVDMRYNLMPACAQVGNTFIIGTHVQLVRKLSAQLANGETETTEVRRDTLEINGPGLERILRENFNALVMNTVLDEGKDIQQARADINGLLALVALFDRAEYSAGYVQDGSAEISLRLDLAQASGEDQ